MKTERQATVCMQIESDDVTDWKKARNWAVKWHTLWNCEKPPRMPESQTESWNLAKQESRCSLLEWEAS